MDTEITKWMSQAIELAKEALKAGEVPVACLFVYESRELARGRNMVNETKNATQHAEMVTIENVLTWCKLNNKDPKMVFPKITVIVTVEPCIMCASALRNLRVSLVVYGCSNDRFGGCGSVMNVATNEIPSCEPKLKCISGILAEEAVELLKTFYKGENLNAPEEKRKVKQDIK